MPFDPVVYVADAGSVSKGNFHWVCSNDLAVSSQDPAVLAKAIAKDLSNNCPVALGYESPLFVPCEDDQRRLGRARPGEINEATGSRSFNAGAGASVLATGIQSLAWVLNRIRKLHSDASATTNWEEFATGRSKLFVWEAFVTGSEKAFPPSHSGDARLAIEAFHHAMQSMGNASRIKCNMAFSLAGAAILYSGLSKDLALLQTPCVVLRPVFSAEDSASRISGWKQRQIELKAAKKKTREDNVRNSRQGDIANGR